MSSQVNPILDNCQTISVHRQSMLKDAKISKTLAQKMSHITSPQPVLKYIRRHFHILITLVHFVKNRSSNFNLHLSTKTRENVDKLQTRPY